MLPGQRAVSERPQRAQSRRGEWTSVHGKRRREVRIYVTWPLGLPPLPRPFIRTDLVSCFPLNFTWGDTLCSEPVSIGCDDICCCLLSEFSAVVQGQDYCIISSKIKAKYIFHKLYFCTVWVPLNLNLNLKTLIWLWLHFALVSFWLFTLLLSLLTL